MTTTSTYLNWFVFSYSVYAFIIIIIYLFIASRLEVAGYLYLFQKQICIVSEYTMYYYCLSLHKFVVSLYSIINI